MKGEQSFFMHPLEMAAAWIVIGAIVAWYLGRPRAQTNTTGPGSEFTMALWFKIAACFVFLGLLAGLFFFLPEASHPRTAAAMTLTITAAFAFGLAGLFTARIKITADGFRCRCLWMVSHYRFEEFNGIEFFRYGFTLRRKDGRLNVGIPVFFANSADLFHYLKRMIETPKEVR